MKQSKYDPCVYFNISEKSFLIIAVYVDDILIFSKDKTMSIELKNYLKSQFQMKDLGPAKYFLGLNLKHDLNTGVLSIDQEAYIQKMLERFGMTDCNSVSTPMDVNVKLCKMQCPKSVEEKSKMSNIPYQELIGSLLFAAQISRPDICYPVNFLSRFNWLDQNIG